ncbi:DUF1415 domain-containing protein [Legionella shakespearei]|uniref:DUF1415 domain-containing protein n=1 Tax=Legionella shakespearei DSM 23087 TaxID=1122169 RepID=A0A0W0Z0N3_9GAMM|nr:DUF1415 domain-containing protein [Legionella shakespearei]KTD62683.1 hypothetical protein Lsha_0968 [Legionella shakespearei DSM 23087]
MTQSDPFIVKHTLNWIRSFIVPLNICPFAKGSVNKGTLRISVSESKKKAQALEDLMSEVLFLDENPAVETTLLVFSHAFKDFFAYLDFVDLAEQLIQVQGYEGTYQLASFHPDYYFADSDPEDVSNYTNRSPYPMLHLLREDMLEKAIHAYGDTDTIPEKNCTLMRELGLQKVQELIRSCAPED